MKLSKWLILPVAGLLFITSCDLGEETDGGGGSNASLLKLYINEFLASNDAATIDPDDDGDPYDDWVEIYNGDTQTIDIGGMYVSDSKDNITAYQIPTTDPSLTTIQPGGFLVIWFDDVTEMTQGILHVGQKLGSGGEDIVLAESDGLTIIDQITYEAQITDISYGRIPDGSDTWEYFSTPTPGATNSSAQPNVAPVIVSVSRSPQSPSPIDDVAITAVVTDDYGLDSVFMYYKIHQDSSFVQLSMNVATTDTFTVTIGAQSDSTTVYYYIKAVDESDLVSLEPSDAPTTTSSYTVSAEAYVPPALVINEFLASNDTCCTDEHGNFDDFIEIFNNGTEAVDIGGMYLTDDLSAPTTWQIPTRAPDSTTINPGGFLLLWADKESEQGILHIELKLGSGGEQIGLFSSDATNTVPIDTLTYPAQTTDISRGRNPDGSDTWEFFNIPTPGESNN
ncbi:MAG: lamin tail domain-containing protein [Candidatus Marinimicrobia bacterium]|jgi:hypothetical protein|nr:lamin tail domain-containing protein [Candidatus Neomarinimicrobiota bacterium]MBT3618731.1 lamin tail domain-containing protein [Candidatus Neomarinimicrobiota bacterium]MBT3828298.1 lamin tail domain-containing protein [Candidatus Neomarinimicrobiota bacterium]MBT3997241.1 lamin tail domain-containing protein [Candidatus Neomarinimicrobiota bacterium]MBT4280161.1 lamin tail domain-containing protein [Candidatus Neomarinimicrobiota bacterium]